MKTRDDNTYLQQRKRCESIAGLPLCALLLCLLQLLPATVSAATQDMERNQPARAVEFATANNPSRFVAATPAGITITEKPALKFNPEYRADGVLFARFPAEMPKQGAKPPTSSATDTTKPSPQNQPTAPTAKTAPKSADAAPPAKAVPVPTAAASAALSDAEFLKQLAGSDGAVALNVADTSITPDLDAPINIDEAVAFALKNNFEVLASEEKVRGSYWDKMGAYAQYGPSVEFSIASGAERSKPASFNDNNGTRVLNDLHHRRDRNWSVRQPIIDLSVIADILTARDKEGTAQEDHRDVRETVAQDTVNVFLKLIQARLAIQLADQYKQYLDDLGERMQARVEGGGATSADADRIKGRSALAASARIEALGEYESDLSEFQRLTKVMPWRLNIPEILVPAVPSDTRSALDRAIKNNPAYMSGLRKIDTAADDRNKSLVGLLPKLSVQYNKNYSYNAGGAAGGNPVDGVYPSQSTEAVMVVAQWTLYSATAVTGGMAGAAKAREMRLRAQDTLSRIEQGIRSNYTAINAALARREVLQKTVEANQRVVQGFEAQYKEGSRTLFDLLDAYEQLYNAKLNLMRVIIAQAQASYQIRRQMGDLVPSLIKPKAGSHG